MLERDSKLSELDQRADNLQEGASQFQTQVGSKRCTSVRVCGRVGRGFSFSSKILRMKTKQNRKVKWKEAEEK